MDGSLIWEVAAKKDLNEDEIESILEYLLGQSSDGWGEGFEQQPACLDQEIEYYYSPWVNKKGNYPKLIK